MCLWVDNLFDIQSFLTSLVGLGVHDYTAEFLALWKRPPCPAFISSFPSKHSPVFVSSDDMPHATNRTLQTKNICTRSISRLLRTLKILAIIVFFETLMFSSWVMVAGRQTTTFCPCLAADRKDRRNCPVSRFTQNTLGTQDSFQVAWAQRGSSGADSLHVLPNFVQLLDCKNSVWKFRATTGNERAGNSEVSNQFGIIISNLRMSTNRFPWHFIPIHISLVCCSWVFQLHVEIRKNLPGSLVIEYNQSDFTNCPIKVAKSCYCCASPTPPKFGVEPYRLYRHKNNNNQVISYCKVSSW